MSGVFIGPEALAPASRIGGKGAALSQLVAKGFDVPAFFAIPPEAFDAEGLKADLSGELAALGDGPFAVRSSAREEDGASASHAGQFLTVLDVAREDVAREAFAVWRSGAADSVRAYRIAQRLDPDGGQPAVLVQRLVKARAAGVAFSADPVSGDRRRIVVSAVEGLGDKLVAGEADGQTWRLDKAAPDAIEGPLDGVLTPSDLHALRKLALDVEAAFSSPQDLEWAFEGEHLYLLQARPITTLGAAPIADDLETIFDNSNIVESYPGLVSPLTYSFASLVYARVYRMFVRLVGVDEVRIAAHGAAFDNMLGRLDGRVYYNLANWYRALALLPGFALNSAYMETMMGLDAPLPRETVERLAPKPARGFARVVEYARLARVGVRLARHAFGLPRMIADFNLRLDAALARPAADLLAMPLTALIAEYRRIEADLLDRWDAPLVNDFLCMIGFGASRKLLERWGGERGLAAHNAIMIGQGDIISAEPAQRIRAMGALAHGDEALIAALQSGERARLEPWPQLSAEIDAYIARFGDRCTEELKLESATLDEEPRPLLASVAAAARMAASPPKRAETEAADLRTLFEGQPLRGLIARQVVGWAKARVRDRENLRFERTRIFGRARKLFMAAGAQLQALGLIAETRDVLYLTAPEVLGAVEGAGVSSDLRGLAALRKAEMRAAAQRPQPPARVILKGAVAAYAPSAAGPAVAPSSDTSRRGVPCSAGVVRARARVIRDPSVESLAPGEALIASHTDPGWIAVFVNAAAVVAERGSLLSHSAIVARELGIPCVVALKGATDWIRTGDLLEIDGQTGLVSKLDG